MALVLFCLVQVTNFVLRVYRPPQSNSDRVRRYHERQLSQAKQADLEVARFALIRRPEVPVKYQQEVLMQLIELQIEK